MKTIVSVLTLLILTVAAQAQNARKVVFWSGDKSCGYRSKAISEQDLIKCETVPTERGPVSFIGYNDIGLMIAFLDDDDQMIVAARITNSSQEVVPFDSDLWGAAHFKSKAGFYSGERPIVAETSLPSRDIVRGMSTGAKMDNSLETFMADGTMTTERREMRRPDGTRYTVIVPVQDQDAQAEAVRRTETRTENITNEQRRIRSTALTAKSVPARGSVAGLVYFRRVKKADFVLFSIKIEETIFVFQLPRKTK